MGISALRCQKGKEKSIKGTQEKMTTKIRQEVSVTSQKSSVGGRKGNKQCGKVRQ